MMYATELVRVGNHYFFLNDPATTEFYTFSLHDALPISLPVHFAEEAVFPATKREVRHRRGNADVDADISGRKYRDRKSTRLNSSHSQISYAVFCLKKKKL